MSYKKMGNIFPVKTAANLEQEIAVRINQILREHHQDKSSVIKEICGETGIGCNTIRRWYEGRNPPSSGHLIILALHYPAVLKMFLELSGYGYLASHILSLPETGENDGYASDPFLNGVKNVTTNVTIKSEMANLNERQVWFLEGLKKGQNMTAHDICQQWPDGLRTARRDIAKLKEMKLVRFSGGRKAGRYEII